MKSSTRGVTLIELLIAVTLVSVLTLGIMFAMRVGLSAMERSNERLMDNRRVLGVERVMYAQLAGFMPVKGKCQVSPSEQRDLPFFQGAPQTMRFVSSYSLEEAARGYPRILEFQVIPRDDGPGLRLIVNEHLYIGPPSTLFACVGLIAGPHGELGRYAPVQIGNRSFVLADNLERCLFAYKEIVKAPPGERWVPEWRHREQYPAAVRIDLWPLDHDSAKLQVLPVTIPFRVDREPMVKYEN